MKNEKTRKPNTNASHVTISLKKHEREALRAEAERQGLTLPQYCAKVLRERIKIEIE